MKSLSVGKAAAVTLCLLLPQLALAQARPRARDLGIPFDGTPGPLNAITDVKGVEVGHATLISGEGKLKVGAGPVRTGVTAVLPRGKDVDRPGLRRLVLAQRQRRDDRHDLDRGVGLPRRPGHAHQHAQRRHRARRRRQVVRRAQGKTQQPWVLPVVAETYDGYLNDINGFHVKEKHVFDALDGGRGRGRWPRATSAAAPA